MEGFALDGRAHLRGEKVSMKDIPESFREELGTQDVYGVYTVYTDSSELPKAPTFPVAAMPGAGLVRG